MTGSTAPTAPPDAATLRARRRRYAIYAVLLVVAFAALISALMLAEEEDAPTRPPEVVAVSPAENASEVRQATVFAEVAPDFDAVLIINGREIPLDQLDRLQTGNLRISFTPGDGKEFDRFRESRVCSVVEFWPVGADRANTSKTYSWCFDVH